MAQDLITITPESLQLQLPNIPKSTLKTMYRDLYQYLRNYGEVLEKDYPTRLLDVQRKISKIQYELRVREGKLGADFHKWDKYLQTQLRKDRF